jgi:gamma-glutamyltranspeptidase/glutathione hydrolase
LSRSPESRSIYVRDAGFRKGDILINTNIGKTFDTLAGEGAESFYTGRIAERIEADLTGNGGFITVGDLMVYEVREVAPLYTEMGRDRIWTVPPEGGGAILIEILNILNRGEFLGIKPFTPDFYHYIAQAAKIAFIDRMTYMGDVDVSKISHYNAIFNKKSIDERFRLINREMDTPTEILAEQLQFSLPKEDADTRGGSGTDTTHFAVIDEQGNGLSCSYTLNLRYGSKWSVEGTGMLMNGSMDGFAFKPGTPNYFGVMGNRMNLFEVNKRPASNMAPVLVTRDGELQVLIGSPGGPTIPTTITAILLSVLCHDNYPPQSCEEGRTHHQAWPDLLYREKDTQLTEKLAKLESRGYKVKERGEPIGDIHGIFKYGDDYLAVSDYRREGTAAAYTK